jgi:nucleotide-binding universal stress UspA family protein
VLVVKQDQRWSPKRILCPVDFSTTSGRAAAYAAFLAEQWGASLELLHIIPGCDVAEIQALGMLQRVDVQRYLGDMRARADRRMAEFLSKWPLGKLMYRAEIHHGRPHEQILARAEDWAADLILIGTLGRDGVAGMLIGNTAERVLRGGPCSVLIVRAPSAKVSPQ